MGMSKHALHQLQRPLRAKICKRFTLGRMAHPLVKRSIEEEAVSQSMVFASDDYAEMKAARAEGREPRYRNR